jgi:SAM-dependent methyltransferase
MAGPELAKAVQALRERSSWYHTIELAPGVVTPGFCDLRDLARASLSPELVAGRRCLDVGTFDGFWAFAMEERGAGEVLALDLPDPSMLDHPPPAYEQNMLEIEQTRPEWGRGFELAAAARGSTVERVLGDVRTLTVDELGGPVDFVLCGTLLQHLRDPVGALERLRDVLRPGGEVLIVESFSVRLTLLHPRNPVAEFRPGVKDNRYSWWVANLAAQRAWARAAGFEGPIGRIVRRKTGVSLERGVRLAASRFRRP